MVGFERFECGNLEKGEVRPSDAIMEMFCQTGKDGALTMPAWARSYQDAFGESKDLAGAAVRKKSHDGDFKRHGLQQGRWQLFAVRSDEQRRHLRHQFARILPASWGVHPAECQAISDGSDQAGSFARD